MIRIQSAGKNRARRSTTSAKRQALVAPPLHVSEQPDANQQRASPSGSKQLVHPASRARWHYALVRGGGESTGLRRLLRSRRTSTHCAAPGSWQRTHSYAHPPRGRRQSCATSQRRSGATGAAAPSFVGDSPVRRREPRYADAGGFAARAAARSDLRVSSRRSSTAARRHALVRHSSRGMDDERRVANQRHVDADLGAQPRMRRAPALRRPVRECARRELARRGSDVMAIRTLHSARTAARATHGRATPRSRRRRIVSAHAAATGACAERELRPRPALA